MIYVLHSGGAAGADMLWETEAIKYNISVKAYSFKGHSTKSQNRILLNEKHLTEGLEYVRKAAILLKKNVPMYNAYILSLLCRNWFQVKNSEAVFAVSTINHDTGIVEGGTGWACAMAHQLKIPVYVFDQIFEEWNVSVPIHNENSPCWKIIDLADISVPSQFAGIGSRKLEASGTQAIKDFFLINFNSQNKD